MNSLRMNNIDNPSSDSERYLSYLNQGLKSSLTLASSTLVLPTLVLAAEEKKKKVKKPKVLETPSGIKYIELKKGSGPFPNNGDFIIMSYTAYLSDGTIFDDREKKGGKPVSFKYGEKQMIQGIEDVLETMQPGGERTCTIPAELAYGKKGVCFKSGECLVPPNETLKYFIKLKSVGAGYN